MQLCDHSTPLMSGRNPQTDSYRYTWRARHSGRKDAIETARDRRPRQVPRPEPSLTMTLGLENRLSLVHRRKSPAVSGAPHGEDPARAPGAGVLAATSRSGGHRVQNRSRRRTGHRGPVHARRGQRRTTGLPRPQPSVDAKVRETFVRIPAGDQRHPRRPRAAQTGGAAQSSSAVLMLHGSSQKNEVGDMYARRARSRPAASPPCASTSPRPATAPSPTPTTPTPG